MNKASEQPNYRCLLLLFGKTAEVRFRGCLREGKDFSKGDYSIQSKTKVFTVHNPLSRTHMAIKVENYHIYFHFLLLFPLQSNVIHRTSSVSLTHILLCLKIRIISCKATNHKGGLQRRELFMKNSNRKLSFLGTFISYYATSTTTRALWVSATFCVPQSQAASGRKCD